MGKWVDISDVERSAAEVAAEILSERVGHVALMLPLAAHEYDCDIEHVHQLRVACRRSGAALEAFRPLLKSQYQRLRSGLRKIRQAAGPARDTDVLLERLWAESGNRPCHGYLVEQLERQRHEVQTSLVKLAKRATAHKLNESVDRCVAKLEKQSAKSNAVSFLSYAQKPLRRASRKMFQRTELKQPTVEQLHKLRIAGKRLRYSIEIFHSAFPSSLRKDIYPFVEEVQSRLGQLNDHATAQLLFQRWLAALPANDRAAQLAQRVVDEHEAAAELRDEFLKWWTPQRVSQIQLALHELA